MTIYQQVTVGGGSPGTSATIEDDCVLGAGAKIFGSVHIGKGAKIGANAVVLTDVPAGATAVGVPARIIMKHASEAGYSQKYAGEGDNNPTYSKETLQVY